ncbi:MAG TPA: chromate transporter, partial [Polyangiaceae bacterium]
GLALAQLSPGPLATQLAIYLGWLRGRVLGAALVSLAFILPSFVMVLALSALYVSFGGLAPLALLGIALFMRWPFERAASERASPPPAPSVHARAGSFGCPIREHGPTAARPQRTELAARTNGEARRSLGGR